MAQKPKNPLDLFLLRGWDKKNEIRVRTFRVDLKQSTFTNCSDCISFYFGRNVWQIGVMFLEGRWTFLLADYVLFMRPWRIMCRPWRIMCWHNVTSIVDAGSQSYCQSWESSWGQHTKKCMSSEILRLTYSLCGINYFIRSHSGLKSPVGPIKVTPVDQKSQNRIINTYKKTLLWQWQHPK